MNKHCNRCQTLKPASEFQKNKNYRDGLQSECKQCMKDRYLEKTGRKPKKIHYGKWEDSYC